MRASGPTLRGSPSVISSPCRAHSFPVLRHPTRLFATSRRVPARFTAAQPSAALSQPVSWGQAAALACPVARQHCTARGGRPRSAALDEAPPAAAPASAPAPRLLAGLSGARVSRLEALVDLKKLYRNCIRAEALLRLPSPVYTAPPAADSGVAGSGDPVPPRSSNSSSSSSSSSQASMAAPSNTGAAAAAMSGGAACVDGMSSMDMDEEQAERLQQAVEVVAEMQLTAEQLKMGLRALPAGFGNLFNSESAAAATIEAAIRDAAKRYSSELRERAAQELPNLPFTSESKAQAACDVRNSRYDRRLQAVVDELGSDAAGGGGSSSGSLPDRLNQAEKVAGKFVARRIKPALQRAQEKQIGEVLTEGGQYLRGLWARLNGGGGRRRRALPPELVQPPSSRKGVDKRVGELGLQLEALEKRLVDASRAREARLRKAGAAGRVAVAIQLRSMDAEVVTISRQLAVRTLQLEMEYIFSALEEEALDASADELLSNSKGPALAREGSTAELALLVAEYALLLEQLDVLAASIDSQTGGSGGSSGNSSSGIHAPLPNGAAPTTVSAAAAAATAAAAPGLSLIDEDVLAELAAEIPDLRYRVGVGDGVVFGFNPLSPTRLKIQAAESSAKVFEGVNFLTRGVRLLLSDVGNGGRLFGKAALGGTLKQREVAALRRTARDLLTFIPFIIILIVPLTPLGHVLVFGFIQRYFPGFFPSQFTTQRQDLMMRYEELQRQLATAQAAAQVEEEEAELARAAAAVARLTAPDLEGLMSTPAAAAAAAPPAVAAAAAAAGSTAASRDPPAEASAAVLPVDRRISPSAAAVPAMLSQGAQSSVPKSSSTAGPAGAADNGGAAEGAGPAAAKVRLLEEQLEEAREEVHSAPEEEEEEEDEEGSSGGGGRSRRASAGAARTGR